MEKCAPVAVVRKLQASIQEAEDKCPGADLMWTDEVERVKHAKLGQASEGICDGEGNLPRVSLKDCISASRIVKDVLDEAEEAEKGKTERVRKPFTHKFIETCTSSKCSRVAWNRLRLRHRIRHIMTHPAF